MGIFFGPYRVGDLANAPTRKEAGASDHSAGRVWVYATRGEVSGSGPLGGI